MKKSSASDLAAGMKDRMTVSAAAEHIGLSPSTLNKMRHEGRGPRYMRLGNRVMYRRQDLDAYLDSAVVETADSRAAA